MKNVAKTVVAAAMLSVVALAACSTVQPDAGHEAVLVRKPLIFGSGGVDDTPVKTGLKYVAFTTEGIDVNMQPRRVDVEFTDLMTSDGVPIDFHAVLTLQVIDSVKLVRDFGADMGAANGTPGFWTRNLDQPFRTAVRDAVKAIGVEPATAQVAMLPQNYVKLQGKEASQMIKLMEVLEDHEDTQHVWSNFDIEEKEIEASLA